MLSFTHYLKKFSSEDLLLKMKVRRPVVAAMVMSTSNAKPAFAFTFPPTTSLLHRSPFTKRSLASLPRSGEEFGEFMKEKERRELLANASIFAEINAVR